MNRALKSALIQLRTEGITLDAVDDLEHLLTLAELAKGVTASPALSGEAALLTPVLRVGNLALRHLSIGARKFLVEVVAEWFSGDYRRQDLAYAFAMAHTGTPETLWDYQTDRAGFVKALDRWERTIGVPLDVLKDAIRRFQEASRNQDRTKTAPSDYRAALLTLDGWKRLPEAYRMECEAALIALEVQAETEPDHYGPMLEMLVREYGHTPEYWLWQIPERDLNVLLEARRERLDAEARALQGARDDRFQRAHYAFVSYVDLIRSIKRGKATR